MLTVTLTLVTRDTLFDVEMPSVTTCMYAAKRLAEEAGLDPGEQEFCLVDNRTKEPMPQDNIVAELNGAKVLLGVV